MTTPVDIIAAEAERLGVGLTPLALAHFDKYLDLLNKWSASVNLIGTTDPDEVARVHVADCLALVPLLGDARRIIDVGSGAGLPGAALAIARPDLHVTALEPIRKKHAFLSTVRREVGLANFSPLAERDDTHADRPDFEPYDAAVSRATWPPLEWLEHGAALVRGGGRVLAMEGREQSDLPTGATRHPYGLGDRTRSILLLVVD